jgi:hypothetical protein
VVCFLFGECVDELVRNEGDLCYRALRAWFLGIVPQVLERRGQKVSLRTLDTGGKGRRHTPGAATRAAAIRRERSTVS